MITGLGVASVFVTDYDEAKAFFVQKLGFTERHDLVLDNGYRWLTVGPSASPELQLSVTVPGPPVHDDETARMLRTLLAKGVLSGGAWNTDDCRATFELYTSRGVEFLQEPQERPYGVEAVFRDPFGNWYSLNETNRAAFDAAAMKDAFPELA
ncbi:Glyoxalase/bleomycin resistance protein/dioxygenase [Beutenbergia cavernae DSM 12333]|uniref:Glyoxalase/bleomycin resistance protein/dioxygenase n=1 Tax=Beutenbergia cavernae (strain ATCC BAA-8 / DSM 12333 / CCUG 43141 / JCM 11478 / NBRC 16432 / NCIMB 13614 / HKI 0122) TaxID=471853 RepID=C5BWC2_BEUC1|nr:VOC family protein [Beutenbergia cavernae]ACQ78580.1 Glyoxalase/bleomycin resistance protein/dioxygenase [Beutenbergia cavernae DSM 12333]